MDNDYHFKNDVLVINLRESGGRLKMQDTDDFIRQIISAGRPSIKKIAFDMSSQEFLNSTGLGELIQIKDSLMDRNIKLLLINPSLRVKSLITMVGVDQFFQIFNNEDELV